MWHSSTLVRLHALLNSPQQPALPPCALAPAVASLSWLGRLPLGSSVRLSEVRAAKGREIPDGEPGDTDWEADVSTDADTDRDEL